MLRSKDTIIFAIATPRGSLSAQKIVALRHTQIPIPSISPSPLRAHPAVPARPREMDFTSHPLPMEALDMLLSRRSVKRFAPDVLPAHSDLQRIADAGANAPTGRGRQSPFIVVVTDRAVRDQLSRLNTEILGRDGDPFYGAPVVMVVLADRAQPTYLYDGSLVMGNLLNAAHALGWGACWIHRAREIFERPEGKALLSQWGIDADVEGIRPLCSRPHRTFPFAHPTAQRRLHPFRLIARPTPFRIANCSTRPGAMETHLRPGQKKTRNHRPQPPSFLSIPSSFFRRSSRPYARPHVTHASAGFRFSPSPLHPPLTTICCSAN